MNVILEDNRQVIYRDWFHGVSFEVVVDKKEKKITLMIDGTVLRNEHYKSLYGGIYKRVLTQFQQEIFTHFVPFNALDQERCLELVREYRLGDHYKIEKKDKKVLQIENYFRANLITKQDNGKISTYITRKKDGVMGEYLLENVSYQELQDELNKMLIKKGVQVENLREDELANMVLDQISKSRRQYRMENARQFSAKNPYEQVSLQEVKDDDMVNTEIGVIKNDPEEASHSYRVVEQHGDHYHVVSPDVDEIKNSSLSEDSFLETDQEERVDEQVYYVDYANLDIYDEHHQRIGRIGEGYEVDYQRNHLIKGGQDLGGIQDIRMLGEDLSQRKPKVRTLEKENQGNIEIHSFLILLFITAFLLGSLYLMSR